MGTKGRKKGSSGHLKKKRESRRRLGPRLERQRGRRAQSLQRCPAKVTGERRTKAGGPGTPSTPALQEAFAPK